MWEHSQPLKPPPALPSGESRPSREPASLVAVLASSATLWAWCRRRTAHGARRGEAEFLGKHCTSENGGDEPTQEPEWLVPHVGGMHAVLEDARSHLPNQVGLLSVGESGEQRVHETWRQAALLQGDEQDQPASERPER